jgi:hypothetical protein
MPDTSAPPPSAATAMTLRDGSIVGGARGQLPSAAAADALGAAVRCVFTRWTALRLAVEGCWGGPDSDAKAGQMAADVVTWFKEGHGERREGDGNGEGVQTAAGGGTLPATPQHSPPLFLLSLGNPPQSITPTSWRTSWPKPCSPILGPSWRTTRRAR